MIYHPIYTHSTHILVNTRILQRSLINVSSALSPSVNTAGSRSRSRRGHQMQREEHSWEMNEKPGF